MTVVLEMEVQGELFETPTEEYVASVTENFSVLHMVGQFRHQWLVQVNVIILPVNLSVSKEITDNYTRVDGTIPRSFVIRSRIRDVCTQERGNSVRGNGSRHTCKWIV